MSKISTDNYKDVNIEELALDANRLGTLVFSTAHPHLEKLQAFFRELEEYGFEEKLTGAEVVKVKGRRKEFIDKLEELRTFELSAPGNPVEFKKNYETQIISLSNTVFSESRHLLTWLRQEAELLSADKVGLEDKVKRAALAEQQYAELYRDMQRSITDLEDQKMQLIAREAEVASKHGSVASTELAHHFEKQANKDSINAENWLKKRDGALSLLIAYIVTNFAAYLGVYVLYKFGYIALSPRDFFAIEYGIINVALVSLLSYRIAFASINYRVHANLAATNRHRRNVGQTLRDFLETRPDTESRSQIVKLGVEALFRHLPIGYITKNERPFDGTPNELVNIVFPKKE